jgi:protocatechuate 3,4-dioxygenase beta subunit
MKFKCQATFVVVPLLVIFLSECLGAQTTSSGALTGTVIDATNRVVPNATIELRNTANGALQEAKTDADGTYLFSFLQPGNYILKVTHPGLKTTTVSAEVQWTGSETHIASC